MSATEEAPRMLLDGQCVAGSSQALIVNPATGGVASAAPMASVAQLHQAIAAARRAGRDWAANPAARKETLLKLAAIIADNREALSRTLSLETGLPIKTAMDEVGMATLFLKYRANEAGAEEVLYDDEKQRVQVVRRAMGVVGAIIPWNAPMMITCEKIGTAFAAGDTIVVKPSPLAPLTLLLLGELAKDAAPPGVLNILPGSDEVGEALVAHPDVAMISFTGSISAGRAIMADAARTLKRLSLELGGNDAAIVLPDIDVAKTASKLFFGAFYRTGQVCAAIKRLYVHRSIHDDLVGALSQIASKAVLGDPFDDSVTMGPLSNKPQFERVKSLVAASVARGGKIAAGGAALERPGFFFAPTLVTDVAEDNPLVREEQFGPALPIIAFDDEDDAINAANATQFGLGGSIWSNDVERATALARRLESGSAWVNRHGIVMPDIPFGGMKLSGLGRANGRPGLDAYTELQTISVALARK